MKSISERLYASGGNSNRHVVISFWIRRAWRLWPTAWLWLSISLVAAIWFNSSGRFGQPTLMVKDAAAAVLQIANFNWVGCIYYNFWKCSAFDIYWSLSLEEQFYLFFPLFLCGVPRRWLISAILLFIAIQFFVDRPGWTPWWAVRSDAILYGVLLAICTEWVSYKKIEPKFFNYSVISYFMVSIAIFLIIVIPSKEFKSVFSTGLLALLSATLVWVASYDKNYIWPAGITKKILCWIGSRSYGLYLIHIPAFSFTYEIMFQLTDTTHFVSFWYPLISILFLAMLAEMNFRFVEWPLRNYGRKKTDASFLHNA